jgi:hypothetical protein
MRRMGASTFSPPGGLYVIEDWSWDLVFRLGSGAISTPWVADVGI